MKDLLELVFDSFRWDKLLDKSVQKTIPIEILTRFSKPEVRAELLDSIIAGNYHVSPPKIVKIPKDNGTFREIYVCKPVDRLLFSLINDAWVEIYSDRLSPAAKAYLPGKSCGAAVKEVASLTHIRGYKLDLSKYFDSVPITIINETLRELDTGSPLEPIIWEFYNSNVAISGEDVVTRYKSLCQGCALASFLCNYIMHDVDTTMQKECEYYCRYSDDMLLIGENSASAMEHLVEMLAQKGLTLNPSKVELITDSIEFKFLGFGIKGSVIDLSVKDFLAKKKEIKHSLALLPKTRAIPLQRRLRKAVVSVQRVLFSRTDPYYGWFYNKACTINTTERITLLEEYIKEHIRAYAVGSWNYTSNKHKVSDESLRSAGWVSLVQLYDMLHTNREIYGQEHFRCIQQHLAK